MKNLKKGFGKGVATLLLLIFSVTILPLEFFHAHAAERVTTHESEKPCNHKLHISSKGKNFCWICNFHYDKTFTRPVNQEVTWLQPDRSLYNTNETTVGRIPILFLGLRGPPVG